jgi:predicted PurR-regulated permease PerM
VAAAAIVVVALGAIREVIIPLALAAFLAVVFSPGVDWLEERRIPRPVGAVLVILLIAAIASLTIGAVAVGIVDQADELRDQFDAVVVEVEEVFENANLSDFVDSVLSGSGDSGGLLRDGLGSAVGSAVGTAAGFLSGMVLGSVLLYYLLKDGPALAALAAARASEQAAGQVTRILADAADSVRAYVKGRTILALVQGVTIGVVAAIVGVPLALAIAVVNFFGAYIPYLGGFIGGSFAVLLALSEGGITLAIVMLVVVLGVSVGLESLLEPMLLGDKLQLHPIVVLLTTVLGGLLVGIVGMFLAAPSVAIGRTLWRELRASGFFEGAES